MIGFPHGSRGDSCHVKLHVTPASLELEPPYNGSTIPLIWFYLSGKKVLMLLKMAFSERSHIFTCSPGAKLEKEGLPYTESPLSFYGFH